VGLDDYLREKKKAVEEALDRLLPATDKYPAIIHRAMRYSVFAGGKRIRPILAIAGYEACGGVDIVSFLPVACSLELIHTFSFIHDDLPCMDDDDYRRGTPTSHRVFGEAIALLAGDALFNLAYRLIVDATFDGVTKVEVVRELSEALGTEGVIGGQVVDIISEGESPTENKLQFIHSKKTGRLILASLKIGGICARAPSEKICRLADAGGKLGLAFQIIDDLLDVEGDFEVVGKEGGKDFLRGKLTYPSLHGADRSRQIAEGLCADAKHIFEQFGNGAEILLSLTDFILHRIY
jgi:geranylgeranyl diphosphate synthase type II